MISSTPWVPAFSTSWWVLNCVAHVGSWIRLSMKARSKSLFMKPARSPSSWCDRPPVPRNITFASLCQDRTARPTASPSAQQRRADGSGNCTVLMAMGTMRTAQRSSGYIRCIGLVIAWSTSISWQVVRSKSAAVTSLIRCQERSSSPRNGATCGMPQPSSALVYCGAAPMAKVGSLSRKKFSPWSL